MESDASLDTLGKLKEENLLLGPGCVYAGSVSMSRRSNMASFRRSVTENLDAAELFSTRPIEKVLVPYLSW